MKAGETAPGLQGFREYAGNFWGFLETRPYMGLGGITPAQKQKLQMAA